VFSVAKGEDETGAAARGFWATGSSWLRLKEDLPPGGA
jgi:hypothetical protein